MALTNPDFSATQNQADTTVLDFTDISTGTDLTLTARTIEILLPNGNYLTTSGEVSTPTYESWPYAQSTISLSLLPLNSAGEAAGEAPTITVRWYAGSTLMYTKIRKFCFNLGDYIFALGLTMDQVANNSITQDTDWYCNKMKLIVNDADAENAIYYGSNNTLAQNSLNRNQFLIQNEQDFF
jgi:hypothetical protein